MIEGVGKIVHGRISSLRELFDFFSTPHRLLFQFFNLKENRLRYIPESMGASERCRCPSRWERRESGNIAALEQWGALLRSPALEHLMETHSSSGDCDSAEPLNVCRRQRWPEGFTGLLCSLAEGSVSYSEMAKQTQSSWIPVFLQVRISYYADKGGTRL